MRKKEIKKARVAIAYSLCKVVHRVNDEGERGRASGNSSYENGEGNCFGAPVENT